MGLHAGTTYRVMVIAGVSLILSCFQESTEHLLWRRSIFVGPGGGGGKVHILTRRFCFFCRSAARESSTKKRVKIYGVDGWFIT